MFTTWALDETRQYTATPRRDTLKAHAETPTGCAMHWLGGEQGGAAVARPCSSGGATRRSRVCWAGFWRQRSARADRPGDEGFWRLARLRGARAPTARDDSTFVAPCMIWAASQQRPQTSREAEPADAARQQLHGSSRTAAAARQQLCSSNCASCSSCTTTAARQQAASSGSTAERHSTGAIEAREGRTQCTPLWRVGAAPAHGTLACGGGRGARRTVGRHARAASRARLRARQMLLASGACGRRALGSIATCCTGVARSWAWRVAQRRRVHDPGAHTARESDLGARAASLEVCGDGRGSGCAAWRGGAARRAGGLADGLRGRAGGERPRRLAGRGGRGRQGQRRRGACQRVATREEPPDEEGVETGPAARGRRHSVGLADVKRLV